MTPHPDTVPSSMTILEALKKMHDNRYLHLPVVDDQGQMAGLVDVLQVSFAMLNQMNTIQTDAPGTEGQGPVWNKFWESSFAREETGSEISASDARSGFAPPLSDVHYGGGGPGSMMDSSVLPPLSNLDESGSEFTFKFKAPGGQVHRFGSSTRSFAELHDKIVEKMSDALESGSDVVLSYCDEENDQVLLLTDTDITEAVQMAYRNQWPLIRLSVTTTSSKKAVKATAGSGTDVQATLAGLNPVIVSGAIGLSVGVVIALAIGLMKK